MSLTKKRFRQIVVRTIELLLIGMKYVIGAALMVGALWLLCGFVSVVFSLLGVY